MSDVGLDIEDYYLDLTAGLYSTSKYGDAELPMLFYVVYRCPDMPPEFQEDAAADMPVRVKWSHEIELDALATLTTTYKTGATTKVVDDTGAEAFDWQAEQEDDAYPDRFIFNPFPTGSANEKPKFCITEMAYTFTADADTDTVSITNECVDTIHDSAYGVARGGDAEPLKRLGTLNSILYGPDRPMSSWHIMRVLCDTLNKIMYESKPFFTVPVFGIYYDAAQNPPV